MGVISKWPSDWLTPFGETARISKAAKVQTGKTIVVTRTKKDKDKETKKDSKKEKEAQKASRKEKEA